MGKTDPDGHYAALKISPGANSQEIRLAYRFLKMRHKEKPGTVDVGRVQRAYDVLRDPARRREYGDPSKRSGSQRTHLSSPRTLAVLAVVLFVAVVYIYGPAVRASFVNFEVGDELYWTKTGATLGEVVAFEADHDFPRTNSLDAYRVRYDTGEEVWYPVGDLKRYCKAR